MNPWLNLVDSDATKRLNQEVEAACDKAVQNGVINSCAVTNFQIDFTHYNLSINVEITSGSYTVCFPMYSPLFNKGGKLIITGTQQWAFFNIIINKSLTAIRIALENLTGKIYYLSAATIDPTNNTISQIGGLPYLLSNVNFNDTVDNLINDFQSQLKPQI